MVNKFFSLSFRVHDHRVIIILYIYLVTLIIAYGLIKGIVSSTRKSRSCWETFVMKIVQRQERKEQKKRTNKKEQKKYKIKKKGKEKSKSTFFFFSFFKAKAIMTRTEAKEASENLSGDIR